MRERFAALRAAMWSVTIRRRRYSAYSTPASVALVKYWPARFRDE